ncbi:MAG: response regulator [Deltaproteobacteria bacterium]|nr:response regulator [Deltaproteobacteria bacterium]
MAAVYYVAAKLALLLAIPPGYATAVWPAAGLALAGVLLFGYGAWPGILLDLNLPKKDGREVLADIKADENLRRIPVVVLTTSEAEQDILKVFNLHANCYITKPVDLNQFVKVVKSIEDFWLTIVKLPKE